MRRPCTSTPVIAGLHYSLLHQGSNFIIGFIVVLYAVYTSGVGRLLLVKRRDSLLMPLLNIILTVQLPCHIALRCHLEHLRRHSKCSDPTCTHVYVWAVDEYSNDMRVCVCVCAGVHFQRSYFNELLPLHLNAGDYHI